MIKARAVIADDEALMRAQLRERLRELWPDLDIAAEAKNGAEAVELVAAQRPDIVFLDIRMPAKTGIEAARDIARLEGALPDIVFVTAYDQHALDAFDQGAIDYVLKPAERARLSRTVERLRRRIEERRAAPGPAPANDLRELLAKLADKLEPQAAPASGATQRRLAAILSADIVGYSRLMQADDGATHKGLLEVRALFAEHAAAWNGRIVNAVGDAVLAEFGSAVEAVQCAIEIQRDMSRRNSEVPEAKRMQLRIGVNLGDVLVDVHGLYGDGVNVAARLESLCQVGSVALSSHVYEQVRDRLKLQAADRGEHALKNIARPVRIFEIDPHGEPSAQAAGLLSRLAALFRR